MTTVPSRISCSSRRRSLKKPTSRMNGVSTDTVIQNSDGVHGAEHEIGGRAVPGAHFEIHDPHADGGRSRAAEGDAVIENRPDHRRGRAAARTAAKPSPSVTMPKTKMNIAASTTGMARMMKSIMKAIDPARQHALEQFRVGSRIVGVRLEVDRHADPRGSLRSWLL